MARKFLREEKRKKQNKQKADIVLFERKQFLKSKESYVSQPVITVGDFKFPELQFTRAMCPIAAFKDSL